MTRYVALLRGINVGGNKSVPMAELRSVAEALGFAEVSTYINSGNLLFSSRRRAPTLTRELERGIGEHFGFDVAVIIRSVEALKAALAANPYPQGNPAQVIVAFCAAEPDPDAVKRMAAIATPDERFTVAGREVFVDYGGGLARSKLATRFDSVVGVRATARNIRTVAKLVDLAGADRR